MLRFRKGFSTTWTPVLERFSLDNLRSLSPLLSTNASDQIAGGQRRGLVVSAEVRRALLQKQPVVALESTIVSHGMPYPENVKTAKEVEGIIRSHGVIPATIGIVNGVPIVGLNHEQLDTIAMPSSKVKKTSRRDLAYVVSKKLHGATTVSATMFLAAKARISVFVTGGIGGVHRGAENSLDISADLTELGRTPVAVVCAGAKSVLDIPRTLEYLETQGVAVAAYGSDDFPAFFTALSGCKAPCRVDTPEEAAALIRASHQLGLDSGMVIGVPIRPEHAAEGAVVEAAVETALEEAKEQEVLGHEITPFLLKRVRELTGGASLRANMHLIKNNADVGAQIAAAMHEPW